MKFSKKTLGGLAGNIHAEMSLVLMLVLGRMTNGPLLVCWTNGKSSLASSPTQMYPCSARSSIVKSDPLDPGLVHPTGRAPPVASVSILVQRAISARSCIGRGILGVNVVRPAVAIHFVAILRQHSNDVRMALGGEAVGGNRRFEAVLVQEIQKAPDARFPAIVAVG